MDWLYSLEANIDNFFNGLNQISQDVINTYNQISYLADNFERYVVGAIVVFLVLFFMMVNALHKLNVQQKNYVRLLEILDQIQEQIQSIGKVEGDIEDECISTERCERD